MLRWLFLYFIFKFVWSAIKPLRKVHHLWKVRTTEVDHRAHQGIFNLTLSQLLSRCCRDPNGWVTCQTEDMPRRTDRGKAQANPSSVRESLFIICGCGLLGHLHSCGLVVGPWLWGIWREATRFAWWYKHWYVSQGVICSLAKQLNHLALLD